MHTHCAVVAVAVVAYEYFADYNNMLVTQKLLVNAIITVVRKKKQIS